jgi:hypothetical protein
MFIIIISCYRESNTNYQFITGESWIRLNASNLNVNRSKLYTKEDVKIKINEMYNKSSYDLLDIENKHKNDIKDTVILISEILYKKNKIESISDTNVYFNKYTLLMVLIYVIYLIYTL